MLRKKNNNISTGSVDTLIGNNAVFEGTMTTSGLLRVDGKYTGDINVKGDIIIGSDGIVNGNITTNNIEISGKVMGNIVTSGQLKICSSGTVNGDINVKSFIVEDKAIFEGQCTMTSPTPVTTDKDKTEKAK